MGKSKNDNGNKNKTVRKARISKTQEHDSANNSPDDSIDVDVSVSDAISAAHNVIYSNDESLFGNLFDNKSVKSNQQKKIVTVNMKLLLIQLYVERNSKNARNIYKVILIVPKTKIRQTTN